MRLFTTITRLCFAIACGSLLGAAVSIVYAQAVTPPQPVLSCEQQLDAATDANLGLQKELLQTRYQVISMQEQMRAQQKKDAAAKATPAPAKAAEKK